jgi:putative protease
MKSRDIVSGSQFPALPELLAPAGSPEALRAAVAAGADAVYLSGKRFGARKYAANFSDDEIREAIRSAHARGVRIYVTVNTLIHDRELAGVADYLVWLYAAGVDAVLVQDTGVASLAREIVPDLTLHASTQMTIHNTDGVLWVKEQGFSRVVLARELPLAEILAIAKKTRHTGIGLEVFAHGALCYSYSGQCLLSSVIGGRSGNRGMCAQPCRKPYTLVTSDRDQYGRPERIRDLPSSDRYLLSPKDLCTWRHLPELAKAPVVSLKIEGRMKSPEYVAVVVSTYRRALSAIAAGDFSPAPEGEQDLLLAFNRGFTRGYLFGDRHKALMARDAPDNRGVHIGTVTKQDRQSGVVTVRLDGVLVPETGDGLLFSDPVKRQDDRGFLLNNAPVVRDTRTITFIVPRPVAPGFMLSITSSRELEARARQIVAHAPADLVHKIPVDLSMTVDAAGRISIEGQIVPWQGKVVPVSLQPDFCLVPARTRPLTPDQLEAQVRKSGDTPFVIRNCSISYSGTLFAPVGELNRMRREFLVRAGEALVASFIPGKEEVARSQKRLAERFLKRPAASANSRHTVTVPTPPALILYANTQEAVSMAVKAGCDNICFEPAFLSSEITCRNPEEGNTGDIGMEIVAAMAACRDAGVRFMVKLPRITRDEYLGSVLPVIAALHADGLDGCMVENPGTARAVRTAVPGMILSGGAGLNIFNHRAACYLAPWFSSLMLSQELSGNECRELVCAARTEGCTTSFALIVQGTAGAMVTEDCLLEPVLHCSRSDSGTEDGAWYGIRDETGRIFPVRTDGECRTHIGNAVETCLIDHLPAIVHAGISEVVIDARGRSGAYAGEMVRIYREGIRYTAEGAGAQDPRLLRLKAEAKARSLGGITAGHFVRGLKE